MVPKSVDSPAPDGPSTDTLSLRLLDAHDPVAALRQGDLELVEAESRIMAAHDSFTCGCVLRSARARSVDVWKLVRRVDDDRGVAIDEEGQGRLHIREGPGEGHGTQRHLAAEIEGATKV